MIPHGIPCDRPLFPVIVETRTILGYKTGWLGWFRELQEGPERQHILLIDTFLYISFCWYSRVSFVSHVVSSNDAVLCAFHMMSFLLEPNEPNIPRTPILLPSGDHCMCPMTLMNNRIVSHIMRRRSPPLVRPI